MYGKLGLHLFMQFYWHGFFLLAYFLRWLPSLYIYGYSQSKLYTHTYIYSAVTLTGNAQSSQQNLSIAGIDELQILPFTENISNG